LFLFIIDLHEAQLAEKYAGRAFEAPCTIQEARCSTEGQPQAASQLWLPSCSRGAHATLAREAA